MAEANSIVCPGCRIATTLETRAQKPQSLNDTFSYEVGECNNCAQHFLVIRHRPGSKILQVFPQALPRPVSNSLPESIRSDFLEALICQAAGAHRAAVTMARRALQGICLDHEAPAKRTITGKDGSTREVKNDLSHQVDWLLKNQVITKPLHAMAHEVRTVGNKGAHPEDAEDSSEVTAQDSSEIIDLLDAFSQTLYVAPAILAKRIEERKAAAEESDDQAA